MNTVTSWRILREPQMKQRSYSSVRVFFLAFICSQSLVGCAIPKNLGSLKSPAGITSDQFNADTKECMEWAVKFRNAPLSHEEQVLLDGIETARFSTEGGRGRNGYSDHYVLCLINRGYQWVPDKKLKWF
ncbi:MAG: hypothetical protein HYX62_06070 [Gammaproteobacteria bacterium]|nr:hypothetical protein [Gammaproteobacteria bacterium]